MIKVFKIIGTVSFLAIMVLVLGGNYSAVKAEEMPKVIAQAPSNIKELPKTGLPLVAVGLAALFPGGLLLRRVLKRNENQKDSPNAIWTGRQLRD